MDKQKVYFPGLNALRFFAALSVMVTHIELLKHYMRNRYGFNSLWYDVWGKWHSGDRMGERIIEVSPLHTILSDDKIAWYHPIFAEAGPLGVIFFFVLSGFLITYLLFRERERTKGISVRHFYIRRFLRIWPLYYFLVIIGFLVLPHFAVFEVPGQSAEPFAGNYWSNFALFLIIFPNLALALHGPFANIGQLWSIGVEEQFYLGWPWLMKRSRKPLRSMLVFIGVFIVVKAFILGVDLFVDSLTWNIVIRFFAMTKLESMAIGGLGAWVLFRQKTMILAWIYHRYTQMAVLLGIPLFIFFTPAILQNGIHLLYSAFFLVIIMNVSANPKSILKLEHPILHSLGKISYGLYMYHMLVITAVLHLLAPILGPIGINSFGSNAIIYLTAIAASIALSYLSYFMIEERFIRLKSRYTKVISGDDARQQ